MQRAWYPPPKLFGSADAPDAGISIANLLQTTAEHLKQNGLTVEQFSDKVGFEIGPALSDFREALERNVDFLRWLCAELHLDWHAALPNLREVNRVTLR